MYNTGLVQTSKHPVLCSSKFSINIATGAVTVLNGTRVVATAGVGTGVITITLPQVFTAVESVHPQVLDSSLSGAQLILTQGETTVGTKTTLQFTLAKGSTPAAITTGTYTIYISVIGVNK